MLQKTKVTAFDHGIILLMLKDHTDNRRARERFVDLARSRQRLILRAAQKCLIKARAIMRIHAYKAFAHSGVAHARRIDRKVSTLGMTPAHKWAVQCERSRFKI